MFRNYLKIAFRNLVRTKAYSIINICGLSLGVACCLLLALYIEDEFQYDRHHERLSDLYRIDTQFEANVVGFDKLGSVSPPIAMTLKDELPEIEAAARIVPSFGSANLIQYKDNKFYESNAFAADAILPAGGAPNPARATLADSSEPNTEMGRPRGGIPSEVLPSASRLPSGATVEGKHTSRCDSLKQRDQHYARL